LPSFELNLKSVSFAIPLAPDKHADLIHYLLALDNSGQEENSE
jgi:hypothetical protein